MPKNPQLKDKMGILQKFKWIRQKSNSHLLHFEYQNRQGVAGLVFRERESSFSLDFPSFGSSVRFGPRSKVVLRGEG